MFNKMFICWYKEFRHTQVLSNLLTFYHSCLRFVFLYVTTYLRIRK